MLCTFLCILLVVFFVKTVFLIYVHIYFPFGSDILSRLALSSGRAAAAVPAVVAVAVVVVAVIYLLLLLLLLLLLGQPPWIKYRHPQTQTHRHTRHTAAARTHCTARHASTRVVVVVVVIVIVVIIIVVVVVIVVCGRLCASNSVYLWARTRRCF
jgi:hypothetical protein